MAKSSKPKAIYGVHPGVKMIADWIDSLPSKTGRSLEQWKVLIRRDGPDEHKPCREWLKEQYGIGSNAAWWLVDAAQGKALDGDPEEYLKQAQLYVAAMYAGPKSALLPLHDAILDVAAELGTDVKACPCQTIVPLYRHHVFAQIKPSTRTRIDLGLALAKYDGPFPSRIIDTGGKAKKDRITHRIPITSIDEIDAVVREWLTRAYDFDAASR